MASRRYEEQISISFSTKTYRELQKISSESKRSISDIVRECVDAELPRLKNRLRNKRRRK